LIVDSKPLRVAATYVPLCFELNWKKIFLFFFDSSKNYFMDFLLSWWMYQ